MKTDKQKLRKIAESQYGYFTSHQAAECGYVTANQTYHVKKGNWLKVDRAVYRFPEYEQTLESEFVRCSLIAKRKCPQATAVISHESALYYHGLTETRPEMTTVSVSAEKAYTADRFDGCDIYPQHVTLDAYQSKAGFLITTPYKTLRDLKAKLILQRCWQRSVQRALLRQLIQPNESNGLLRTEDQYSFVSALPERDAREESDMLKPSHWASAYATAEHRIQPPAFRQRQVRRPGIVGSQSAFTLVELLVVISIIGILASLLMPAVRKGLEMSRLSACANNEKQMGLVSEQYKGDYSGWFVPGYDFSATGSILQYTTWQVKFCDYLGTKYDALAYPRVYTKLFDCPADTTEINNDAQALAAPNSYGINAHSSPGGVQDGIFVSTSGWLSKPNGTQVSGYAGTVHERAVPAPSKTMFAVDGAKNNLSYRVSILSTYSPVYVYRYLYVGNVNVDEETHNGMNNFVFCDGHVAALSPLSAAGTGDYYNPKGIWTKQAND